MDVVCSAAAVVQLLGQVISLWQQISQARQAVRRTPKAIKDLKAQLSNLVGTAQEIERRPELHVPSIYDQLALIYSIGMELKQILLPMEALRRRSPFMQGLYALGLKQRDESTFKDVLDRLQTAEVELGIRIGVAHVGITSGVVKGMERVEQGVQTVIKGKDRRAKARHHFLLDRNVAQDTSDQRNGIAVMENSIVSTSAMVSENEAAGNSRQRNLILIGRPSPQALGGLTG
ncbi:hypothetical protein DL769_005387 [Monosporascus sp. CRB-8-3]|nr:hypothetical protein DL769_005387 [Monosporascus sp. CRB-8-3]